MIKSKKNIEKDYKDLVEQYLEKEIDANCFKNEYMTLWRKYRDSKIHYQLNLENNNILDRFFTALDSFCSDDELRDDDEFDEIGIQNEIEHISKSW